MFKAKFIMTVVLFLSSAAFALPDPTKPSSYRAENGGSEMRLESILFSPSRKVAVINGAVLSEGDTINDNRVIEINKESVKVSRRGKVSKLKLKRTSIRQER